MDQWAIEFRAGEILPLAARGDREAVQQELDRMPWQHRAKVAAEMARLFNKQQDSGASLAALPSLLLTFDKRDEKPFLTDIQLQKAGGMSCDLYDRPEEARAKHLAALIESGDVARVPEIFRRLTWEDKELTVRKLTTLNGEERQRRPQAPLIEAFVVGLHGRGEPYSVEVWASRPGGQRQQVYRESYTADNALAGKSVPEAVQEHFGRLDTNGDHILSASEIDAATINPAFSHNEATALMVSLLKLARNQGREAGVEINVPESDLTALIEDERSFSRLVPWIKYLASEFDQIDRHRDGLVTDQEMYAALLAAPQDVREDLFGLVRAVLKLEGLLDERAGGVTRDQLLSVCQAMEPWESYRRLIADRTRLGTMPLFADPGHALASIRPDAIKQGAVGDCLFLAGLASLAASRPELIESMIKDDQDGSYTVTFPGVRDRPQKVTAPTAMELAVYAASSEHGIWPAILEKALGQLSGGSEAIPPQDATDPRYRERRAPQAAELIRRLSMVLQLHTLGQLTGEQYLAHTVMEKYQTGESWEPVRVRSTDLRTLHEILAGSEKSRLPVVAGLYEIPSQGKFRQLVGEHAYGVIDYMPCPDNPAQGRVALQDPLGRAEPVDRQGQPIDGVEDGRFVVTLEEFSQLFSVILHPSSVRSSGRAGVR